MPVNPNSWHTSVNVLIFHIVTILIFMQADIALEHINFVVCFLFRSSQHWECGSAADQCWLR